ncbi:MAG: T9SS type A sorting domain-containing protein [Flavobacteriales bacterium]
MRSQRFHHLLVCAATALTAHSQTAQFSIVYNSVPPPFVTAFDHAADIWAHLLVSPVPIKVNVSFFPLGANALGITFPNGRRDFPGAPQSSTWYATSLANSIAGVELNPGENDIDIFFSNGADWYADTTGTPAPGQHDFVSVALHELGHGLGFVGLSKKVGADGSLGLLLASDFAPLTTTFPWPQLDTLPGIFDRYLNDAQDGPLTMMPNPGTLLGGAMTGNALYFNGPIAMAMNGGQAPRIYAPGAFALGSSCVHLNESTYPAGNPNELMTPFSSAGTMNHHPGLICLAMLRDIGWNLAPGVGIEEPGPAPSFIMYPNPADDRIVLELPSFAAHTSFVILDAQGRVVHNGATTTTLDVGDLAPGAYIIKLDGVGAQARFMKN